MPSTSARSPTMLATMLVMGATVVAIFRRCPSSAGGAEEVSSPHPTTPNRRIATPAILNLVAPSMTIVRSEPRSPCCCKRLATRSHAVHTPNPTTDRPATGVLSCAHAPLAQRRRHGAGEVPGERWAGDDGTRDRLGRPRRHRTRLHPRPTRSADGSRTSIPISPDGAVCSLDVLAELGVLEHVHMGHGPAVYHLTHERHVHLVCRGCGVVLELTDDVHRRRRDRTHDRIRHRAQPLLQINGRCADCAATT